MEARLQKTIDSAITVVTEGEGEAVVLIHGFTDSPRQFAELADSLYAAGDNVLVPRLPHHALRQRDVGELARDFERHRHRIRGFAAQIVDGKTMETRGCGGHG